MGFDNKNNYLSTAKALGIILMVVGHSGCPDYLHRLIYYFHMPLFFFLSGYFFNPTVKWKSFAVKKIRGVYYPYIKWSLVFLVLHNVFFHIGIYNSEYGYNGHAFHLYDLHEYLKRFCMVVFSMDKHEPMLGGFWFLKTLFLSSILVKMLVTIITCITPHMKMVLSFLLSMFLLLITKYYKLAFPLVGDLSLILMGSVFYLMGYFYHTFENKSFYNWYWLVIIGFGMMLFAHYYHSMSMACEFKDVIIYVIVALVGIYCVIGICYHLEKQGVGLYYLGKNTMQVLALHFLSFKIVSVGVILYYPLPFERLSEFPVIQLHNEITWFVYSSVGVLFPILIKVLYDKALLYCRDD